MDPQAELERVRRSQLGDRTAFEDLIRAHARLVWAFIYGWVKDPAWTEDLVQETFLKAWEALKDLKQPEAFRGWLLTIARRLAWRQAEVSGRSDAVPERAQWKAPDDISDPEEARDEVQRALARLPERYRVPVTLHFLNGMNYGSIERATGLANGSLRGLVARGVAKLRAELAPWWRSRHDHA
ncbi:MAG TPA: sigma-70 family RNA polymerase sigma factor [Planctomycetota bacterium]|jgi:RNA polymerase sigma-70 factor (ECF subfamily)|nr:sigma-70 family RNA polymerase sigma factor [Planctomycetota bacterium]